MKTKLLRKLRNEGRSKINILSLTTSCGMITGMTIGYDEPEYRGLFSLGDSKDTVLNKAAKIYMTLNMDKFRKKYSKYSRANRNRTNKKHQLQ